MKHNHLPLNLYRTPFTPAYWREASAAMSSLKLLVFAALMVAVTRALSMIPGIPIAHTKLTWGYTLSTMVGVLVYALCFFRRRITVVRLVAANLLVNLLVNAGLGSIWSTVVRGGVYWGWFIPSMAKNMVTILPKAAVLYFLFQALLPILQRMNLIPRQVDGVIRLI